MYMSFVCLKKAPAFRLNRIHTSQVTTPSLNIINKSSLRSYRQCANLSDLWHDPGFSYRSFHQSFPQGSVLASIVTFGMRRGRRRHRERKSVTTMTRQSRLRESFSRQHCIQHCAIVGSFTRWHHHKDVRVVRKPAQKDVELGCLCMHDQKPCRGRGRMRIASCAVFECLHDVG